MDLSCDQVILAAPAFRAAEIVRDLEPELSQHLAEIPFVNVGVVNIEFRGRVLDHQVTIIKSEARKEVNNPLSPGIRVPGAE